MVKEAETDKPVRASGAAVVEMQSITKDYPSTRALDDVSICFRAGEVHGLIGENGAGKSTLMNILCGARQPTSGILRLHGEEAVVDNPAAAQRLGISMIHQELNVVGELTVAENIFLGHEPSKWGFVGRRQMMRSAAELLGSIGCEIEPTRLVKHLSIAEQQMVEIAKALSHDSRVLIMDEPTAVLTQREVSLLMDLIRDLRSRDVSIVYISHILPEVLEICDRVTVLRDGSVVHEFPDMTGVTEHQLANEMVGRELSDQFPPRQQPQEEMRLNVDGVNVPGRVHNASFSVRRGEVFGFAGLIGAGRTELGEAIAGLRQREGGTVTLDGEELPVGTARDAVARGIAYVSEDRRGSGLVMGMDVIRNTTLVSLQSYCRGPFVDQKAEKASTERHVQELAIKVGNLRERIDTLSGGNQQKVALAKWLETEPRVLILDEPTRGIDVGAKAEIYRLIQSLAQKGLSCVVISSEMNELIGLCHRIAVMRDGEIRKVIDGEGATEQAIMQVAAGVEQTSRPTDAGNCE